MNVWVYSLKVTLWVWMRVCIKSSLLIKKWFFNEEMRWALDLIWLAFNLSHLSQGGSYSNKKGLEKAKRDHCSLSKENFERGEAWEETRVWRDFIPEFWERKREFFCKFSKDRKRKNMGTIPKTNLQQARILRLYRTVLYNKVFKVICTTIGIVLYNTIFEVKVQHLMLFIQHKFRDSGTCFFKAKKQHRNRGRTTGRIIAHVSPYNMEIEASVQQFVSARLTWISRRR